MEKLIELINRKIADHKHEIMNSGDYKEELKKKIQKGHQLLQTKSLKVSEVAMEILTLNEKISFHQAAIKVLSELKKELNNEG
jgi:hypothetical protein